MSVMLQQQVSDGCLWLAPLRCILTPFFTDEPTTLEYDCSTYRWFCMYRSFLTAFHRWDERSDEFYLLDRSSGLTRSVPGPDFLAEYLQLNLPPNFPLNSHNWHGSGTSVGPGGNEQEHFTSGAVGVC